MMTMMMIIEGTLLLALKELVESTGRSQDNFY